jgi:hypothetical protein
MFNMVKTTLSNCISLYNTLLYFIFPKTFSLVNKNPQRGRIA